MKSVKDAFDLTGKVAVITGGAGLLGPRHAAAIAEMGGTPVLWDLDGRATAERAEEISGLYRVKARGVACDITNPQAVADALSETVTAVAPSPMSLRAPPSFLK